MVRNALQGALRAPHLFGLDHRRPFNLQRRSAHRELRTCEVLFRRSMRGVWGEPDDLATLEQHTVYLAFGAMQRALHGVREFHGPGVPFLAAFVVSLAMVFLFCF